MFTTQIQKDKRLMVVDQEFEILTPNMSPGLYSNGAIVDSDGDRIIFAAGSSAQPWFDGDAANDSARLMILLYNNAVNEYVLEQTITLPDGFYPEMHNIAISGTTIAVGCPENDTNSIGSNPISEAGAVYVYVLTGATWTLQQKIVAGARVENDHFGYALALDGDTLLIRRANYVQSWVRDGAGNWTTHQEIYAMGLRYYGGFYNNVAYAIAIEGNRCVIHHQTSSPGESNIITWDRPAEGSNWVQTATLSGWQYFTFHLKGDTLLTTRWDSGPQLLNWDGTNWLNQQQYIPGSNATYISNAYLEDGAVLFDENNAAVLHNSQSYIRSYVKIGTTWTLVGSTLWANSTPVGSSFWGGVVGTYPSSLGPPGEKGLVIGGIGFKQSSAVSQTLRLLCLREIV